jgi:hypothetical protein
MQNITTSVTNYIKTPSTDYALLINGAWGSGKTYYLKNSLNKEIINVEIPDKEHYKVLYVSLNGMSNINQLSQSILLAFLKLDGKNKISQAVFSSIGTGINKLTSFISQGYFSFDITKLNLVSFLPISKIVFVFDDLERINSMLALDEVLGYINTNFVEHSNAKVILVGDIAKIENQKKFKDIKEKLIGREFIFSYNSSEIFSLLKTKYSANKKYLTFLENSKENIVTLIDKFEVYNLRTIFYFGYVLEIFYKHISSSGKNEPVQVILFAFFISVEFKKGAFSTDENIKRVDLINLVNNFFSSDLKNEEQKEFKTYFEYFANTYLRELRYYYKFFYSIYYYIVFGELKQDLIERDFKSNQADAYLNSLHNLQDPFVLSEDELKNNYDKVLEGLKSGIFNFYSHQYVFDSLFRLQKKDFINITVDELKQKIFGSLTISKKSPDFEWNIYGIDEIPVEDNPDSKEVFSKIKELHIAHLKEKENIKVKNILDQLSEEKAEYSKMMHSYRLIKLSAYFNANEIIAKLSSATNYSVTKFSRFLLEKYRYDCFETVADLPLMNSLIQKLEEGINDDSNTRLQKEILSEFKKKLVIIVSEFNKRIPKIDN